ncbi:MAG: insulinase family protein [Nanoarchaeota archaeon]|nr:insulinase family protein [Nanoarchaeota archaeon]
MKHEFYKKKLKNGVTVLFEKRNLPIIASSASVNWGAEYESEKVKGISHLMEHLMFKQSKNRSSEELAREIEKRGGVLNAFTDEEVTSYWNKMPSKHWDVGLDIASDLILHPKFDIKDFEKEKKVVIEEIKMYKDSPRSYVLDKIKEMLYKKPFGSSIAGDVNSVAGLELENVKDIFKKNYTSDEMIVCCVGKANFDDICEYVEKSYPTNSRKLQIVEPVKINNEVVEKRKGVDQANYVFGFHGVPLSDKKRHIYDVVGGYLWMGMSSRMFQEIREKRGLCYTVNGYLDFAKNFGYGGIYVGTVPEKIKKVQELILKEFKDISKIEKKDVDEVKEQLIGMNKLGQEDSINVMDSLMRLEFNGSAEEHYDFEENIKKVKFEDIKNFKLKNYSSFALIPEK